jgi:predicted DNA-binding protein
MAGDVKENVTFRLETRHKEALAKLAADRNKPVGQILREAVETYLERQERAAWEEEARRASLALAREAQDPGSAEAEHLRMLESALEEFAEEWVWEEEG